MGKPDKPMAVRDFFGLVGLGLNLVYSLGLCALVIAVIGVIVAAVISM